MRAYALLTALALLTLTALPACDKPDVGARCELSWNQNGTVPPPTPTTVTGDYFETGKLACDDLVCIVSPAPASSRYGSCSGEACGYCSKPCVSDRDCYSDETGLRCESLILDEGFIAAMKIQDPVLLERYLGEIENTRYCATPRL